MGEESKPTVVKVLGLEQKKIYLINSSFHNVKPWNPLAKHNLVSHPDENKKVRFNLKINKVFKDPLTRQANEGVKIFRSSNQVSILNSKSEFNHPPTNRVTISKRNLANSTKHNTRRKS